ncbi:MAG TPA: S8 family serine peptidase, partial [Chloroflexota bacterium]|nr:S8 family serine peptidase [Chloroflexota bacterium]
QGIDTYNLNDFVYPQYATKDCQNIKVLGMAPGASLMALSVFGRYPAYTSIFVTAIQYAVDHGANVLNESYGANPAFDNAEWDAMSLADAAAVKAGVTVVVSSGDAGTNNSLGSPATLPGVISAGATTQFQSYEQTNEGAAITFGNGSYADNNISSFSSAGISQTGTKTVDVVAPGDLGWALCSDNFFLYGGCGGYNGLPSRIQLFGGTSESAPLTSGEAALVIEAYRTHHRKGPGPANEITPTPQQVKEIITSTAQDLGIRAAEQGAGLIDSLKAVKAAMTWGNKTDRHGDTLLSSASTLAAAGDAGSTHTFAVNVTNNSVNGHPITVSPSLQTIGPPTWTQSFVDTLNPNSKQQFAGPVGEPRVATIQKFTVPASAQRLDATLTWDTVKQPFGLPRFTLFDPNGTLQAYTIPQSAELPFTTSGYGHVDVVNPMAGTWTAVIWTHANPSPYAYTGKVNFDVSTSNFVNTLPDGKTPIGTISPTSADLQPGQSRTFKVTVNFPSAGGDFDGEMVLNGILDLPNQPVQSGAIPLILRSLVPIDAAKGGTFGGIITGGNGRGGSLNSQTFDFTVPSGEKDMELNVALKDQNYNLEGVLAAPDGLPVDIQSTVTNINGDTKSPEYGQPTAFTNTMQFFWRNPTPGTWRFVLLLNNSISGAQAEEPFTGTIKFNDAGVTASGLPASASTEVAQGSHTLATVNITNTGNTTKNYFVDPRVNAMASYSESANGPLPLTSAPTLLVPPITSKLTVGAASVPTTVSGTKYPSVPITMDFGDADGAPPYGFGPDPDIEATSGKNAKTGNYYAAGTIAANEVPSGFWFAAPMEKGPFPNGAPPSAYRLTGTFTMQNFNFDMGSSTGDLWLAEFGLGGYKALTLKPGQSGQIQVAISPTGAVGSQVSGNIYVETMATAGPFFTTGSVDEVTALPYAYTVSAPAPSVSAVGGALLKTDPTVTTTGGIKVTNATFPDSGSTASGLLLFNYKGTNTGSCANATCPPGPNAADFKAGTVPTYTVPRGSYETQQAAKQTGGSISVDGGANTFNTIYDDGPASSGADKGNSLHVKLSGLPGSYATYRLVLYLNNNPGMGARTGCYTVTAAGKSASLPANVAAGQGEFLEFQVTNATSADITQTASACGGTSATSANVPIGGLFVVS